MPCSHLALDLPPLRSQTRWASASRSPRAMSAAPTKPPLRVILCAPRGFCAGVVRAIDVVERALADLWLPGLCAPRDRAQQNMSSTRSGPRASSSSRSSSEAPAGPHPVIFSAHGVAKAVLEEAQSAQPLHHRRHLPAGDQGASRGAGAFQARPADHSHRPCRASGGDRHDGAIAARRGDAGEHDRRGRKARAGRRRHRLT